MTLEEEVRQALKQVIDPEINQNIVDIGLIYEIKEDQGKVNIRMTFTSPQCPVGPMILSGVKNKASEVKGVKNVEVELTFNPAWTPKMASEELRLQFEEYL